MTAEVAFYVKAHEFYSVPRRVEVGADDPGSKVRAGAQYYTGMCYGINCENIITDPAIVSTGNYSQEEADNMPAAELAASGTTVMVGLPAGAPSMVDMLHNRWLQLDAMMCEMDAKMGTMADRLKQAESDALAAKQDALAAMQDALAGRWQNNTLQAQLLASEQQAKEQAKRLATTQEHVSRLQSARDRAEETIKKSEERQQKLQQRVKALEDEAQQQRSTLEELAGYQTSMVAIISRQLMIQVRFKLNGNKNLTDEQKGDAWNKTVDNMETDEQRMGLSKDLAELTKFGPGTIQQAGNNKAHKSTKEEMVKALADQGADIMKLIEWVYD